MARNRSATTPVGTLPASISETCLPGEGAFLTNCSLRCLRQQRKAHGSLYDAHDGKRELTWRATPF